MEGRQYEEFQPELGWIDDATSHTLVVNVGAFTREQLRVQRDATAKNLKISGERRLVGNRWSRFKVDVPFPDDSNVQALRARFENGTLYAVVPKVQVSRPQQPQPIPPLPSVAKLPDKPKAEAQSKARDTAPNEEAVKSKDDVQAAGSEKPTTTSKTKEEPKEQSTITKPREETRAKEAKTLGKRARTSLEITLPQKIEESPPLAQPTLLPKILPMQDEPRMIAKWKPENQASMVVENLTIQAPKWDPMKATEKVAYSQPVNRAPMVEAGLLKDRKKERPRPPTKNGSGQGGQEKGGAAVSKDDKRQLAVNVVVSGLLVLVFGIYFVNRIWYGLVDD